MSNEPNDAAPGIVMTYEDGVMFVHEAVNPETDFIVTDGTSVQQYEAARRAGKRIVTVDPATGATRATLATWLRQDPDRVRLIHPDIIRANAGQSV